MIHTQSGAAGVEDFDGHLHADEDAGEETGDFDDRGEKLIVVV